MAQEIAEKMTLAEVDDFIRTIPEEVRAVLYSEATIVNNLPEVWDELMHDYFVCQGEFFNETDARVAGLKDALLALAKLESRNAVNFYDGLISKYQKANKGCNWEQAEENILKMDSGLKASQKAIQGQAVKIKHS